MQNLMQLYRENQKHYTQSYTVIQREPETLYTILYSYTERTRNIMHNLIQLYRENQKHYTQSYTVIQ